MLISNTEEVVRGLQESIAFFHWVGGEGAGRGGGGMTIYHVRMLAGMTRTCKEITLLLCTGIMPAYLASKKGRGEGRLLS